MKALCLLVVLVSCANESNSIECHAPEKAAYDCAPIDPATAPASSCHGGPAWRPAAGPTDAPLTYEDPDLVFPTGCTYKLDECGCCYGSGRVIDCHEGSWIEPI